MDGKEKGRHMFNSGSIRVEQEEEEGRAGDERRHPQFTTTVTTSKINFIGM